MGANVRALGRADAALGFIKEVKSARSCNVRSQSAVPAPIPDGCVTDGGALHAGGDPNTPGDDEHKRLQTL